MPYAFNPLTGLLDNTSSEVPQIVHAKVHNADSVTLQRGDVVYSFGAVGDTMSVKLASNASETTSSKTLGFVNGPIAPGATGLVTIAGRMEKLSLGSPFVNGDALWLDSTAGDYTRVKPVAPNHSVYLGVVERANNGNGIAYVKVQNGYELNEIHDVLILSVSAHQVLRRNSSNTVWENTNDGAKWDSAYTTVSANSAINWDNSLANQYTHTNFLPLSGGTLVGKLNIPASTSSSAGLNIGTGSAPTVPVNGDIWIGSQRLSWKSTIGSNLIAAAINDVNTFTSNQIISVSGTSAALRITQTGTGNALVVEDSTNPDATPFVVDANGSVGIGLSSVSGSDIKLTVVGDISSTAIVYASGGNSERWNSVYSTVQANSATNWNYQGTDLKALSSGWESTRTTVQSNSATLWNQTYYNLPFGHQTFSPVALSSYYIVDLVDLAPLTVATTPIRAVVAPISGEFVAVTRSFTNTTTSGTSEGSTLYLVNLTQSLSSVISNDVKTGDGTTNGRVLHNYWTLSSPLSVNAGDLLAIRWDCANWVTAPDGSRQTFNTVLKTRIYS